MSRQKIATDGYLAELDFQGIANEKGWGCVPATNEQDRVEHWDYMIVKKRTKLRVDVKSKRKDIPSWQWDFGEDYVMVELTNTAGGKGWLYCRADAIAFQLGDKYLIVDREQLASIVHDKLKNVFRSRITPYLKYRRGKRVTTIVPVDDLMDAVLLAW